MNSNPAHSRATREAGLVSALELHEQGGDFADRTGGRLFRILWPDYCGKFVRWGLCESVAEEVATEALLKILSGLSGMRDT